MTGSNQAAGISFLQILVACLFCGRGGVEASHRITELASIAEPQHVLPAAISNRTGFHFQAYENWINDPNGPMYYNGLYHLFYQFNPKQPVWGNIVWAHSYSTDMINWKPLQTALYPSKPFDINGCWSGSVTILPGNVPAIFYTGIDTQNRQVQNIAFPKNLSDPYLREWVKPDYNPVINPSDAINASAFRDPTTAWYGPDGRWRTVVGSKQGDRGMAILYRSRDFINWVESKEPLHSIEGTGMWECPDFFPVSPTPVDALEKTTFRNGLKHVFKVSLDVTRYEYYTIGTYDFVNDKYIPDGSSPDNHTGLRFDYGNFYASKTFYDGGKKRRILWGWSNESDTVKNDWEKGWAGIQAIPRAVWLHKSGKQVVQWPIKEIEQLRHKQVTIDRKTIKSNNAVKIKGIETVQADVVVSFDVSSSLDMAEEFDRRWTDPQKLCVQKGSNEKGGVGPFGLYVLASGDQKQRTAVFFRIFKDVDKHVVLMCHDPSKGWKVYHLDVKSTFLNGNISEEIHVTQPEGFILKGQEDSL